MRPEFFRSADIRVRFAVGPLPRADTNARAPITRAARDGARPPACPRGATVRLACDWLVARLLLWWAYEGFTKGLRRVYEGIGVFSHPVHFVPAVPPPTCTSRLGRPIEACHFPLKAI